MNATVQQRNTTRYAPETLSAIADRVPEKYIEILAALNAGKTYEQIGADLGLNGGTVRSRLNRARVAVERVLAGKPWRKP